ncbi:MAG: hypothetical protein JXR96_02245 [Deltaproteobacteria bacterium]|nr:hypothetical protein [Deltaproteobacteria bacterium]
MRERSSFAEPQAFPAWGFVAIALLAVSCEHEQAPEQAAPRVEPVGIRIEPPGGLPAAEVVALIDPPLPPAKVAPALSSLVGLALKGCSDKLAAADAEGPFRLSTWVEDGKVLAAFDKSKAGTLKTCLYEQIHGKQLDAFKPGRRTVEIQFRLAPASRAADGGPADGSSP